MHFHRAQAFFLASGVAVGTLLLFGRLLFSKRESQFRDDLWPARGRQAEKRRRLEDSIDKKILLEHRPDPSEPEEPPVREKEEAGTDPGKPPFRLPNFRGAPHEVLGVAADADSETVNRAFKHWIKRYHPDRVAHLGGKYVEQARRRAEQLNTARQELLRQRGPEGK